MQKLWTYKAEFKTKWTIGASKMIDKNLYNMNIMLKVTMCVVFITILSGCASTPVTSNQNQWISLFNGKNLDGWKVKIAGYELNDNYGDTFRVEDGILKVSYDKYDRFDEKYGHLFYKDNL